MARPGALELRHQKRRRKLRTGTGLFDTIVGHIRKGWSPLQIAGRLRRMQADDRSTRVSHETIYLALYALPRGELRRELLACLRQGRQARRPRSRGSDRRSWAPDALRIAARPEEIEERQISTLLTRIALGSAAATKTPTASSVSTCPRAKISADTPSAISTPLPTSSTQDPARSSTSGPRSRLTTNISRASLPMTTVLHFELDTAPGSRPNAPARNAYPAGPSPRRSRPRRRHRSSGA